MDITLSPHRYIQEKGIIKRVGEYLKNFGDVPLFVVDNTVGDILESKAKSSLQQHKLPLKLFMFEGECCDEEIQRVGSFIEKENIDLVIGCGGGKAIDTAKAAAHHKRLPFISLPTSAATCAAWSSSCPVYTSSGEYLSTREIRKNPHLVLVDSQVIAEAPLKYLSAGMGDSLAKWYEGRTTSHTLGENILGKLALRMSGYCREVIEEYGPKAKIDAQNNICSSEVERIIQINIFLAGLIGGIGGHNFRSAAAHAFNYALCGIPKARHTLHGEKVAIGVLIQFVMEGKKGREFGSIVHFYRKLGIPCSMEELGVHFSSDELREISHRVCTDRRVHNLPFSISEDMFEQAYLEMRGLVKEISFCPAEKG